MALNTVALDAEACLSVMACATGLAILHCLHGHSSVATVVEYLGVAILAGKHGCVGVMLEVAYNCAFCILEGKVARFQTFVAFNTVTCCGKGSLSVVACAAGLPFFHIRHREMYGPRFIWECLGMAIIALVNSGVEFMAEVCACNSAPDLEGYILGLQSLVAFSAIAGNSENGFAVMACAT